MNLYLWVNCQPTKLLIPACVAFSFRNLLRATRVLVDKLALRKARVDERDCVGLSLRVDLLGRSSVVKLHKLRQRRGPQYARGLAPCQQDSEPLASSVRVWATTVENSPFHSLTQARQGSGSTNGIAIYATSLQFTRWSVSVTHRLEFISRDAELARCFDS